MMRMRETEIEWDREGKKVNEMERAGREGRAQRKEGKRSSYDGREWTETIMENLQNYRSLSLKDTPAYVDPTLTETSTGTTCSRTSKQQTIVKFIIYLEYDVMPIHQNQIILPKPFRFRKNSFLISRTTENLFIISVF